LPPERETRGLKGLFGRDKRRKDCGAGAETVHDRKYALGRLPSQSRERDAESVQAGWYRETYGSSLHWDGPFCIFGREMMKEVRIL